MTDCVRLAIVGTGMIAEWHAGAIRQCECARLAACYDAVGDRAEGFAKKHGIDAAPSLDVLLARRDVDAIAIATPSGAHMEPTVAAAQAGKHVLCEKPLEITLERADRMIQACEENHVTLACVFQGRTGKAIRPIQRALADGRFGRLTIADAQVKWYRDQAYYDRVGWRGTWNMDGGGALMNQGIHTIDLLRLFAGPPKIVQAFMGTLTHRIEADDAVVACIQFANGALGTVVASTTCAPGFPRRVEISGERGSVALEDNQIVRWSFLDPTAEDERILREGAADEGLKGGSTAAEAISLEGHRRQIEDFARAILEGKEPLIPGREGRHAVELICGIYQAARTGRPYVFGSGA
ncbi:MAG: Gfo/Idh/MocA family oxidoreductase [Candidatus Sumerlaeota bacterium]|nr:Gfo/Idh/MocA family oxidoreductase [Candidatus Sumerlaeota bacterium]